ncbi:MAG: hypothetical protein WBQ10_01030 [Terriglobales bacterium]
MAGKKANDRLLRNGPLAQNNADGQQVQVHAKFQNALEKALRYQRATARDFYRAWNLLYKVRGEDTGGRFGNLVSGRKQPIGVPSQMEPPRNSGIGQEASDAKGGRLSQISAKLKRC